MTNTNTQQICWSKFTNKIFGHSLEIFLEYMEYLLYDCLRFIRKCLEMPYIIYTLQQWCARKFSLITKMKLTIHIFRAE